MSSRIPFLTEDLAPPDHNGDVKALMPHASPCLACGGIQGGVFNDTAHKDRFILHRELKGFAAKVPAVHEDRFNPLYYPHYNTLHQRCQGKTW